ncbi:MAG: hypothetical protein J0H94_01030 [Rhizobiales bacterium]|nr:hypothetical protein [Hyphomicrobiales bacterium]
MSPIRFTVAAACGLLLAAATGARAEDYPFSGLFVFPPEDAAAEDATLYCGYNFFAQNPDGSYQNYHLDLPAYEKDGTIRFLIYTRGQCTAENGKVETCTPSWDADKSLPVQDFVDVIKEIGTDRVVVSFFDTADDARSFFATGKPEPGGDSTYFRCPYDAAAIARYRSDTESTLSADERDKVVVPDLDDKTRANLSAVLAAIRDGK